MIDKGAIINSFNTYLNDTIEGMETVINIIDPLTKQDYVDFRVLLDYLYTIRDKLENSYSVRDIMDYIDLELLFETWDTDLFPYLSEEQNYKETNELFSKLNDSIEEVETNET